MKRKKLIGAGVAAALVLLGVAGGLAAWEAFRPVPGTVGGLAYDRNRRDGYRVYIEEAGEYTPYLVLTSKYNGVAGQTLLLREEIQNHSRSFNDYDHKYYGYYPGSLIDEYLSGEYLDSLGASVRPLILDTEITVTTFESLYHSGTDTEKISRRAFLLSVTELGLRPDYYVGSGGAIEGVPLKYFPDGKSRIAYRQGEATSWWLRSSETGQFDTSAWCVSFKGVMGGGDTGSIIGVRPAFCVASNTPIEARTDIIKGGTAYVLRPPDEGGKTG